MRFNDKNNIPPPPAGLTFPCHHHWGVIHRIAVGRAGRRRAAVAVRVSVGLGHSVSISIGVVSVCSVGSVSVRLASSERDAALHVVLRRRQLHGLLSEQAVVGVRFLALGSVSCARNERKVSVEGKVL